MLYIYFLLYIVYLIIYRETDNRLAVCPHRLACLLVLVGDSPDGGRCVLIGWRSLVLVGDSLDGGRCVLIGWRASWCWWEIVQTVGGVCSSVGVPPGVGGRISDGSGPGAWGEHTRDRKGVG